VPSSASATGAPLLTPGAITPGRYTYLLQNACDDPPVDCPADATPRPGLALEVTVPAGWQFFDGFPVIGPETGREKGVPNDAMLALGWTNFWVGLHSDPCLDTSVPPDLPVGPTVDDFVNAVVAHPKLDVSEPTDVELDGYSGRFFTLTAPADISKCEFWQPWEPGFHAQGPSNIWDVWVMNVDGFRVVLANEYFPQTSADVKTELRAMVESIGFRP
jgi:hypothetical protein